MKAELMIDSLKIITQKNQNLIQQVIRKNKSVNQKLRLVTLYLNQMKSQIYQWISTIIKSSTDTNKIISKLIQLKLTTDQQLAKHRLHILLKKKLNKLKKQSFLHSVDSHENIFQQESKLHELQKSVIHIQKDLNIDQEQQSIFGIQSIIQKSRMINLQYSHFKDQLNTSTISQYQIFKPNQSENKNIPNKLINNLEINQQQNAVFIVDRQTLNLQNDSTIRQREQTIKQIMKQNQQNNIQQTRQINQQKVKSLQLNQINKQTQIQSNQQKTSQAPKIMKKKKKSIYTSLGTVNNLSKQDLFGNILQQSYQSCLQNQNK